MLLPLLPLLQSLFAVVVAAVAAVAVRCHSPPTPTMFALVVGPGPGRTWNIPHVAKVLASTANYMICDDHEFTDDLGKNLQMAVGCEFSPSLFGYFVCLCILYQVYT